MTCDPCSPDIPGLGNIAAEEQAQIFGAQLQILAPSFTRGTSISFSLPQLSHLKNGLIISTFHVSRGDKMGCHVKHPA